MARTTKKSLGDLSVALDELTRVGHNLGIKFVNITPLKIEKPTNSSSLTYQILPIEISLQSKYSNLASYFGSLPNLKNSLVKLRSFQILRDEENFPILKVKMVLLTYLLNEESTEKK